jgi:hypothetical protein
MRLRFGEGRPVGPGTRAFLGRVTEQLAAAGVRVLARIRGNAGATLPGASARRCGRERRSRRIKRHNRRIEAAGRGCRPLVCRLPSRSPWLNPIEPKWVHGKRAVVEPARKLAAAELKKRPREHRHCPLLQPLAQQGA